MYVFITPAEVPFRAVLTGINSGPADGGYVGQAVFSNLVVETNVLPTRDDATQAARDLAANLVTEKLIHVP